MAMQPPVELPPQLAAPGSYSRMVEIINANSKETGVAVEVKKKCADGTYMPADDADLKTADFDARLSQVINAVKELPREKRLAFSREMRDAGNQAYAAGEHGEAVQMYAQAMAGLDASGSAEDAAAAKREFALPILTNMAASFLEMRRPKQALSCADEALGIDGASVKAHLRRGKALLDVDDYVASRASFDAALAVASTPAETRDAEVYRRKAIETNNRVVADNGRYRDRLRATFSDKGEGAGLYADKRGLRQRRSDTAVERVLSDCFADGGGAPSESGPNARRKYAPETYAAAPIKLDKKQKVLVGDALIVAWMLFCVALCAVYVTYGEGFARYVTRTYLVGADDPYDFDDGDDLADFEHDPRSDM